MNDFIIFLIMWTLLGAITVGLLHAVKCWYRQ